MRAGGSGMSEPILTVTRSVQALCGQGFEDGKDGDYMFRPELRNVVYKQYHKEKKIDVEGGTDQDFFVVQFRGRKLFVAKNEVDGLTVMLPEDY